jgi:hypothetical protein
VVEFILDILSMVLGPQTWRRMSGPAVVAGAVVWSVVGLLVMTFGVALWGTALTTQDHLVAGGVFTLGVLVLGDVVVGVSSFLRANREQA